MRWEHYEAKRKRKLEMLLGERLLIKKEERQGSLMFINGNPSYYGSTMGVATNPGEAYMVNFGEAGVSPERRSFKTEQSVLKRSSRSKGSPHRSVVVAGSGGEELDKLKKRQQAEIQTMVEYEMRKEQMRIENEERERRQQERAQRMEAEKYQRARENEILKKEREERKRMQEREEARIAKRQLEIREREERRQVELKKAQEEEQRRLAQER